MQALDRGACFDELRSLANLPKPTYEALPCSPWSSLARLSSGSERKKSRTVKMKRSPVKSKRASTNAQLHASYAPGFLEFAEWRRPQLWKEAELSGASAGEVPRPCIKTPYISCLHPPTTLMHHSARTHTDIGRLVGRYPTKSAESLRSVLASSATPRTCGLCWSIE